MSNITSNKIFGFTLLFILCFAVFIMRRPDIIQNPQFWAEDGAVWYEQINHIGSIQSILLPRNGYFQTISKLTASLASYFPLYLAPIFFNITALILRCCVVMYLLSSRMSIYSFWCRAVVACFILLMPNLEEVHANITNTHWYLSMWLFMILISKNTNGLYWKAHDYFVLALSGLSGPFIVLMLPILMLKQIQNIKGSTSDRLIKKLWPMIDVFSVSFVLISLIQIFSILLSADSTRSHAPLGWSLQILCNILSSHIFIGFLLPMKQALYTWDFYFFNIIISISSLAMTLYVFCKGDWRSKSIVLFPALMLFFALIKPMIHETHTQWPMIQYGAGQRYFLIPSVFWCAIIMMASYLFSRKALLLTSLLMIFAILITGYSNFRISALPDSKWLEQASKFEGLQPGEVMKFDITPPGWSMNLIR
ncbi:TPA: glucosyl transferase [Enterobacter asburiae]